jgi:hypothetical protein
MSSFDTTPDVLIAGGGRSSTLEHALSVHERRLRDGLVAGSVAVPERARVAFAAGCPSAVFRYHCAAYFDHFWVGRAWTVFGGASPTVVDVSDQIPRLLRELYAEDPDGETLLERWARTRVCIVDGALHAIVGTPTRWYSGAPVEWTAPTPGPDFSWSLYGGSSLWPFNHSGRCFRPEAAADMAARLAQLEGGAQ